MKFVRIAQVELSRPAAKPWGVRTEIDGVAVKVEPRNPGKSPVRNFIVFAEVPLDCTPEANLDGVVTISTEVARRSENAIERLADLMAIATFSTRSITSPVPPAGFSGVTAAEKAWLAGCRLSHPAQHIRLVPLAMSITDPALLQLDDRWDGVELFAEALASNHETGRFREFARFFERAFRAQPTELVHPLATFLAYYNRLDYTSDEIERWHQLRNQATHANRPGRGYVLSRDVRPTVMRVEFAACDVLFNKLNWNSPDTSRRDSWQPAGGVLPDERHVIIRVGASLTVDANGLLDGFGTYPYDRQRKVFHWPEDWWLDTTFRAKGEAKFDSVTSLRS